MASGGPSTETTRSEAAIKSKYILRSRARAHIYQPLELRVRQIRLLELLPGDRSETLRANLRIVSLDDPGRLAFETVSYAWGSPRRSGEVEIAGLTLRIPVATVAVLRRMRTRHHKRTLWIDAVCINQDDIDERGEQVSLMKYIYGGSTSNLIHLTDDEEFGLRTIELANSVGRELREQTDDCKHLHKTVYTMEGTRRHKDGDERTDLDRGALQFLVTLPWFRRLWVIQEVRLAPSNTCYLGSLRYDLAPLLRAVTWLNYTSQLGHFQSESDITGRDCILTMFDLADKEYGWWSHQQTPLLDQLLDFTRTFEKSEPRDSVYAVLGMLVDQPGVIVPDYRKDIQTINQEITRRIIYERNDLWTLDDAPQLPGSSSDCSWARRYDLGWHADVDPVRLPALDYSACRGLEERNILASDSSETKWLSLEGVITDAVSLTTMVCKRADYKKHEALRTWLLAAMTILGLSHTGGSGGRDSVTDDLLESLVLAMMAGCSSSGEKATLRDIATAVVYATVVVDHELARSDEAKYREVCTKAGIWATRRCQQVYLINRRLFKTRSGKIGLGPQAMQPDDVIAAVRGSYFPVVLRPYGNHYRLVGFAYVHGLMYGETLPELRAAGVDVQDFVVW